MERDRSMALQSRKPATGEIVRRMPSGSRSGSPASYRTAASSESGTRRSASRSRSSNISSPRRIVRRQRPAPMQPLDREQRRKLAEPKLNNEGGGKKERIARDCPFLVHVFLRERKHFPLHEYAEGRIPDEVEYMHLWWDTALRDIISILSAGRPRLRSAGTRCELNVIYCDRETRLIKSRTVGIVECGGADASFDSRKRLEECKITIGDYIDICVMPPLRG